jgi:hypothetical protein
VPFFRSGGLIDHQHRVFIAEMVDHVAAQVIAHRVVVPHRATQQVLQAIRCVIAGVLGQRSAICPRQSGEQAEHAPAHPTSRLDPAEPVRNPAHQLIEPPLPTGRVYAVAHGHPQDRLESSQTKIICGGRAVSVQRHAAKITNNGCRTIVSLQAR